MKIIYKILITIFAIILLPAVFSSTERVEVKYDHYCTDRASNFYIYDKESLKEGQDEFHKNDSIKAEIIIHEGPIKESPVINKTETNNSGGFSYHFEKENSYLIEINPENEDINETQHLHVAKDCVSKNSNEEDNHSKKDKDNKEEKKHNLSFSKDKNSIKIINSTSKDINLDIYKEKEYNKTKTPENTVLILKNNMKKETDYDKIEYDLDIKEKVDIYSLNSDKKWDKIHKNISKPFPQLNLKETDTFAIVKNGKNSTTSKNQESTTSTNSNNKENNVIQHIQPEKRIPFIIGFLLFIIFVTLSIAIYNKKKSEKIQKEDHSKKNIESYKQIYDKTKKYISKYKYTYSTKSIKESLKEANVPEEIIDKAMDESLGK